MTKYTLLIDTKSNRHHAAGISPLKNGPFVLFVIGVTIGVSFAIMYTQYQLIPSNRSYTSSIHLDRVNDFNAMDDDSMHGVPAIGENSTKHSTSSSSSTADPINSNADDVHAIENRTVATVLFQEVRVLCMILTTPNQHRTRAIHVKRTWTKRCNRIIFMSTRHDKALDSIALNVSVDNAANSWGKTKRAFQHIYQHYVNDADWFLKASDDTYVVMENLRYFLYAYSANDPIYFGYKMNQPDGQLRHGYNAGAAGYVLSRDALRRFGDAMTTAPNTIANDSIANCHLDSDHGAEDIEMGKCMEALNVVAGDTRDEMKRGRFFMNTPEWHLIPGKIDRTNWYWKNMWYPSNEGLHCCSDNAISFHHLRPEQMYSFDYLIYHLRPYGVVAFPQPLPKKVNFTELTAQLLDEKPTTVVVSQSNLPNS